MLSKIRCNPMHTLYCALPVPYAPVWVTRGSVMARHIGTLMRLLAAELRSTSGIFFQICLYLCGTILVSRYSMVWDWRVSRAMQMHFYWPSCSLPFCLQQFSPSVLSFYELVLWGWGLRTDRLLIALSQPCTVNLFLMIIIIIKWPLFYFWILGNHRLKNLFGHW